MGRIRDIINMVRMWYYTQRFISASRVIATLPEGEWKQEAMRQQQEIVKKMMKGTIEEDEHEDTASRDE